MSPGRSYAPSFRILLGGTELRHGVTADVLSVTVVDNADRADSFSFTVRDHLPEPDRLFPGGERLQWMDSRIFDEGNRVEIYMGYADDLVSMMVGEITAVNPSFPASGQPTLRVQGYSLYHRLQRTRLRKPFKATTDSGIVRQIATQMNLEPMVDETEVEYPLVSPKGETCASFLRQRAERICYEVVVKRETLYFQRPRYLENPSPGLTLEWGRSLIHFSPRLPTFNAPTEVTVRGSQTSQGRGKEPLVGTARAGDERVKMGTETGQQIARSVFGDHHLLVEDHNITTSQEANEVARARLETQAMNFITGSGSCIGNPRLRARMVLALKGLGKRFSGNYYVTAATHTIDGGGYRTDFQVKRNAR
ncbi:MAG: phage late control D family protein [Deltaproteobacteria bacterium]|nr:phage late control D family protein [Deltaproteobacteria bacterium]